MKEKYLLLLLIFSGAAASALGVILPQYFGFVQWFSLIPAIYAVMRLASDKKRRLRSYYGYGLLFFWTYYAVCFHWFSYLYPLDFTGINNFFSVIVIIIAIFGLSLLQALISAPMLLVFGAFSKLGAFDRCPYLQVIMLPPLYALFEFVQTLGWWGVPWARLCLGQSYCLQILATASLFGSYIITALIVFVNSVFAYAIFKFRSIKSSALVSAVAVLAFSLNLGAGAIIYSVRSAEYKQAEKIKVAAIQGNYSSSDKWSANSWEVLGVYSELTEKAAAEGAELIIWPETAYPFETKPDSPAISKLEALAQRTGADLIIGTIAVIDAKTYNICYHISAKSGLDGTVYVKRRLVPFGEYVPMRSFIEFALPFMSDISILSDDMTPGTEPEVFYIDGVGKTGSIICFDSIYEELVADTVRNGAELIAMSTNDSWFSDSCGIYMHNNQARLRSIEFARATVRAGNTGVSAIITSTGDISAEMDILTRGYVVGEAAVSAERTLYSYIGNLFIYISAAEVFALLGFEIYRYRKLRLADEKPKAMTDLID